MLTETNIYGMIYLNVKQDDNVKKQQSNNLEQVYNLPLSILFCILITLFISLLCYTVLIKKQTLFSIYHIFKHKIIII